MHVSQHGGCLCGAVRYRISGAPVAGTLCHCRSCRLASGAPSVAWTVVRVEDFRLDGMQPIEHESSPGIFRGFCGHCGTSLTWRTVERQRTIDVTTATLDQPEAFAPTKEIWIEHKLAWETANPTLPHYARSSVDAVPIREGDGNP